MKRLFWGSFLSSALTLVILFPAQASVSDGILATVPQFTNVAQYIGLAPPAQPVRLVVFLAYPNKSAVDAFAQSVNDPSSPSYGAFLTPTQFSANFAPSPNTYSMVEYVLSGAGFSVYKTYLNRKVIEVIGSVAQAEAFFGTLIAQYQYNGVTYYANSGPALVPTALKGVLMTVSGLNNFVQRVGGPLTSISPIGLGPLDIQTAYNEPVHVNKSISGAGTTIAVETAYDFLDRDLQSYWAAFGVHRLGSVARIFVKDPVNQGLPTPAQNQETTFDAEQTSANAPGANLLVIEGADALNATFDDVYETAVTDPRVAVVSTSWGSCEAGDDPNEELADSDLFEEGAAQGQTMFAAAGDNGSKDCGANSPPFGLPGYPNPTSVDFPANSPWVAGAGGTTLLLNNNRTIKKETAWFGSGGGYSALFVIPYYQTGVPHLASSTHRNVPDVALDADPNTPYALYYLGSFALPVGGTSAAAPNMAALYAQFEGNYGHRLGLAQTGLYSGFTRHTYPGTSWHDILAGNNGNFSAHLGYDNVTGTGSLNAYRYMQAMPH